MAPKKTKNIKISPKRFLLPVVLCISLAVTIGFFGTLWKKFDGFLPEKITIDAPRNNIKYDIEKSLKTVLKTSHAKKLNRDEFLKKITQTLSRYKKIESYSLRYSLNKNLTVKLNFHKPAYVIEAHNNQKFVLSQSLKLIDLNPTLKDHVQLLFVYLPELRLPKKLLDERKNLSILPAPLYSSFNISWIFKNIKTIQQLFLDTLPLYKIVNVTWKSDSGFIITLRKALEETTVVQNADLAQTNVASDKLRTFKVVLGQSFFKEKCERLKDILQDLEKRQRSPDTLDLNYSNKAILTLK